jgi:hypothetical protein
MMRIAKQVLIASVYCLWLAGTPNQARAQDYKDLPDAPSQTAEPVVDTTTGVPQREATWRSLPGDFLHDQKDLWTFPLQLAKGRHWLPTLIVVGGTVALIYADPHDTPYFRRHQSNWDDVNDVFDPMITTSEVIALPAGLLAAGYIRHDDREVNTALLATEAYGDSVVINLAMKAVTRRQRIAVQGQQLPIRTCHSGLVGGNGGGGAIPPPWQALDPDLVVHARHRDQRLPHHRIGPLPVRCVAGRRARLHHREVPDLEAALKAPKTRDHLPDVVAHTPIVRSRDRRCYLRIGFYKQRKNSIVR